MALIAIAVFANGQWKKKRIIEEPEEDRELVRQVTKETLVEEGLIR